MASETAGVSPTGLNPDILWRVVGDEALLLDTVSGNYFSLNPVATEIWLRLSEGKDIESIATMVSEKYSIDASRARDDVAELVRDLRAAGIWG